MKRLIATTFFIGAMSAPAFACDGELCVVNKGGKTIWTVTSVADLEGTNPGGKGRTDKAAGGLLTAAGNGAFSDDDD